MFIEFPTKLTTGSLGVRAIGMFGSDYLGTFLACFRVDAQLVLHCPLFSLQRVV